MAANSTHLGAFTGSTIADNQTTKQALQALETSVETNETNITANDGDITDIRSALGIADGAQHMGSFTGSTIDDNRTTKQALQALETATEAETTRATGVEGNLVTLSGVAAASTHMGVFTGSTIDDNRTTKQALQDLETALETNDTNSSNVQTAVGVADSTSHMGTFTGTSLPSNSSVKTLLQTLGENTTNISNYTATASVSDTEYVAPTSLFSTSTNFTVAAKEGKGGSRPGIVFGYKGDSVDQSVGKFMNPHIHYFAGDTTSSTASEQPELVVQAPNRIRLKLSSGISNDGVVANSGMEVVTYGCRSVQFLNTSDRRIKKNITSVSNPLETLRALPARAYDYIDETRSELRQVGFIAQEVATVLPAAVRKLSAVAPTEYRTVTPEWQQVDEGKWIMRIPDLNETEAGIVYRIYYDASRTKLWDLATREEDPTSFLVPSETTYPTLFLYGRYVEDLHHIDKHKIFSTLYAATREIDRLQQDHEARIRAIEEKLGM